MCVCDIRKKIGVPTFSCEILGFLSFALKSINFQCFSTSEKGTYQCNGMALGAN